MSGYLDAEFIDDILKRVDERVQAIRDSVEVTGTPFGMKRGTPEDEAALFEQKCAENPNFARALAYVKGGPELIARYSRHRGVE